MELPSGADAAHWDSPTRGRRSDRVSSGALIVTLVSCRLVSCRTAAQCRVNTRAVLGHSAPNRWRGVQRHSTPIRDLLLLLLLRHSASATVSGRHAGLNYEGCREGAARKRPPARRTVAHSTTSTSLLSTGRWTRSGARSSQQTRQLDVHSNALPLRRCPVLLCPVLSTSGHTFYRRPRRRVHVTRVLRTIRVCPLVSRDESSRVNTRLDHVAHGTDASLRDATGDASRDANAK